MRFVRPANEAIIARRVGTIAIGLFAAKSYLTLHGRPKGGDLSGHSLLLPEGAMAALPMMGWVLSQLAGARVPLRSNEVAPLLTAAREGLGIACLPVVTAVSADLEMIAPGIIGRGDLYLATHRDLRKRARVRSVFDFVVRTCTQRAADMNGGEAGSVFSSAEVKP